MKQDRVRSKRGRVLAFALLLAGGTIAAVALVEAGLRISTWGRPYDARPDWTWGHRVSHNRLGFREREFAVPKDPDTFRIMVLGDSFTWGVGLADEQRYSNVLERHLNESATDERIEVLNFGVSGASTTAELDLLRKHVDLVEPDLIVVGFSFNDPQPKAQSHAAEIEPYEPLFAAIEQLKHLGLTHTANLFSGKLDQLLRNVGLVPDWQTALDRAYDADSALWQDFRGALEGMKELSDARGLPPPVFAALLSGSGDFNEPPRTLADLLRWNRQALQAAQEAGMQVVSFEEELKRQGPKDRMVNPWDHHASAETNAIYAEKIAPVVSRVVASRSRQAQADGENSTGSDVGERNTPPRM